MKRLIDQPLAVQFVAAGSAVGLLAVVGLLTVLFHPAQGLAGGILLALLVVFFLTLIRLYGSIARPVAELSEAMAHYQKGDFGVRLPEATRSEIGSLAAGFNEMAEKIDHMVGDLQKLDVLKSEFVSTVSHELRTPLTSIGGYATLLERGDAGPVTDTQREFLEIINSNVGRLSQLINDLLDVEKMESGQIQPVKEPQDLRVILKECVSTLGILASQKGLELRYQEPSEMIPLVADRRLLIQVFMNLLSNAIKYTLKGFVALEVEERDFVITVRVRDSGVGITAEEQAHLFQKFYRARSGLAAGEGGTGLGLVIARGMVEAHGGKVTVESAPGTGTTFTVVLPVSPSSEAADRMEAERYLNADREPRPDQQAPSAHQSLWIIDGNAEDAARIRGVLETLGAVIPGSSYTVFVYPSVEAAPEVGNAVESPALVILEPGGGVEHRLLLPWLRRKLHKTTPILIMGDAVDMAEVFSAGASAILAKPFREEALLQAVKDLIGLKGRRILVADRNSDLRLLIKRSLERRGFQVDDVDRGNLVLGRLQREDYDLALMDLNFPDVSGVELLKVIRRDPKLKHLPVFVMLDENKNPPSRQALLSWGADQFVGKYSGIGGIVDAISQYLDDRRHIDQPH